MPRPPFTVVAGTVTAIVLFGLVRKYVGPLIPPANPVPSTDGADYLRAGQAQEIPWRALSPELMAEARRTGRPVFLVLGNVASRAARGLDERAFPDPDVARAIGGAFLPARVDLALSPAWNAAVFPAARTAAFVDPGLTVVALSPKGEPVAALVRSRADLLPDKYAILSFIEDVRAALDLAGETPLAKIAREERARLSRFPPRLLPVETALALRGSSTEGVDRASGLVAVVGGARLSPWAIEAIARAGDPGFAADALANLAASPMHDPVAGGAFTSLALPIGGDAGDRRIECTKSLAQNAALAETAARSWAATNDARCADLARRTLAWCLRRLGEGDGVPATVVSDQTPDGLSPYYSLTLRRLAESRAKGDAGAIRAALGADADPQALGRLRRPPTPALARALRALRADPPRPEGANRGLRAARLDAIARALGTARLLGGEDSASTAQWLGAELDAAGYGYDPTTADLPELLSFADAHFADFLTNGRADGLSLAERSLARALARYASPGGTLRAGDGVAGVALAPDAPDLADGFREASAASAVRLCDAVGRALGKTPSGARLRRFARACASRYGPNLGASAASPVPVATGQAGGFLAACADVARPEWRVSVGPDPVGDAAQAAREHPYALAVPGIGLAAPKRPDARRRTLLLGTTSPVGPL